MVRHYTLVNFYERVIGPSGTGGGIGAKQLKAGSGMRLWRDIEKDPGTLVAEIGTQRNEYPWSAVKDAFCEPGEAKPAAKRAG